MNTEQEQEYIELLDTLILISESMKGTDAGDDERYLKAEGILKKIFGHASSALYLYRGTTFELVNFKLSFFDSPSINVLGRAAFEAFLVFNSIFVLPKSDDEKNFRLYAWLIADVHKRRPLYSIFPEVRELRELDEQILATYTDKIKSTSFFNALGREERKSLIEGIGKPNTLDIWRIAFTKKGKTKIVSWKELAINAGLKKELSDTSYQLLAGYSHSGSSSIISIINADTPERQKSLCNTSINLIMITMAFMIDAYCKAFPNALECFKRLDKKKISVMEKWFIRSSNHDANN